MKVRLHFTRALCFTALLLAFSSCEKVTMRITEHTENWLQTKSDAKLHFISDTGEKQEISISVKKDTHIVTNRYGDKKYEFYQLTYQGKDSDLGLLLMAQHNKIDIRNIGQPYTKPHLDNNFATLYTNKNPNEEWVHSVSVKAELVDNLTLNGIKYDRLVHVEFSLPSGRTDKIKEIYYAKKQGLVYFQTTDGQFWSLN